MVIKLYWYKLTKKIKKKVYRENLNINKTNNQKLAGENKQKHNEKFLYKKYCFGIQKKKSFTSTWMLYNQKVIYVFMPFTFDENIIIKKLIRTVKHEENETFIQLVHQYLTY